jgi:hypothetical protein
MQDVVSLLLDNENPDAGTIILQITTYYIGAVKLSLAVYLRNFVRKILNTPPNGQMPVGYLQNLLNIFYMTLVDANIEFAIKRHLFLIFESLLLIYQVQESNQ